MMRWLATALALALLAAGVWLVGFSSVLATERVVVIGQTTVSPTAVVDAAQVPMGLPLVRQDLGRIALRVAGLRPVESAAVARRWPHTVRIAVVERTPVLAVAQPGGTLLVDRHGVAFRTVAEAPESVVLAEVDPDAVRLLAEVGVVADALPPALRKKTASIQAASADSIVVRLRSGIRVMWGDSSNSPLKAQVALALLKRSPRTIDVSAPHNPATR